jgi:hypothetical protein
LSVDRIHGLHSEMHKARSNIVRSQVLFWTDGLTTKIIA